MKKTKILPGFLPDSIIPYLDWIWLSLGLGLWAWEQYAHVAKGTPFSWMIFAKGAVLLTEAAFLYHLARFHAFYFLGMFPLSWLALSRFQWDLCAMGEYRFWAWLAIFLGMEILVLALPDGKKLLPALVPFWAGLIWLFKVSFLLPLAFVTAPSKRFKNASWARWGGLAAGAVFYLVFRGWNYYQFNLSDLYEVMAQERFAAFFLLGWLGLVAFDAKWKGTFRHVLWPLFLLTAGFLLWGGWNYVSDLEVIILQWVLVWMAGYGWEAFRKYMMDASWHGRLVWFVLGLAFLGGVL